MISLLMSGGSSNNSSQFDSDGRNDVVEEEKPRALDGKVNFSSNSSSIVSNNDGICRVSMQVDENSRVLDGDVGLVVDFRISEEGRVSKRVNEVNEFRVCEINNVDVDVDVDDKSENVCDDGFNELGIEMNGFDSGNGGDVKVKVVSKEFGIQNDGGDCKFGAKDYHGKGSGVDYDSMLSMFDQYAANGRSEAVGYGYEIGDMVWGKVKSHPWWPGHIFNEAFASSSVRRTKREGHVLVAFFGDSSYGWFDPAELIPFELNFAEKSRQTNSRTLVKSVEDAVDELNRRQGLGLACKCRNPFNFWRTSVEDYFAVDVGDFEAGFYSASQIKRARDSFQPGGMLDFVKQFASAPMCGEFGTIDFIKNRATVSAFRKAVFEEFDETYAQAFGVQPVRPATPAMRVEPSRVPLSGRLVIAEALGNGKTSSKSNKSKDQLEKDKYLFKRRDEPNESKTQKISLRQGGSSGQSPQGLCPVLPMKGMPPAAVDHASQNSVSKVAEGFEQSACQPAAVEEFRGQEQIQQNIVSGNYQSKMNDPKPVYEGPKLHADGGKKKGKQHKRLVGELNFESSVPVKKIKKKKKEIGRETSNDSLMTTGIAVKGEAVSEKVRSKPVEVASALGDNSHLKLGNEDVQRNSLLPDSGNKSMVANIDTELEFPQLLDYLRTLALNHVHGAERYCPATVRRVILRFRSVVYQKSLCLLAPGENESKEAHGILPSLAASFDNPPHNLREMSVVKPPKPPRLEDPTKGGQKRGPSDRQEEITLKKKKKINDLKLLTTEKKAAQRASEAARGDAKGTGAKTTAQTQEKKATQKPPEVQLGDGREITRRTVPMLPAKVSRLESSKKKELPARAADPTMLVMKFPAGAALPSSAELRAKFARFGPLDHSATRIFWTSSTIRLVYHHKIDAQAALKFANSSTNLFGNTNVRCYLRDVEVETPETASTKAQKEDPYSQSRDPPVLQQNMATNTVSQSVSQLVQLKSCLKKPTGKDGASRTVGNVRGRVKFMLGDEGSVRTTKYDDGASSHGLDFNTEKIHMVIPPSPSSIRPLPTHQLPVAPNNFHHTELVSRNVQIFSIPAAQPMPTDIDISQQMISLLTNCKDVVNNLMGSLGYVPYRPL